MYHIPVVKVVREGRLSVVEKVISSPATAAAIVREHLDGADREYFVVLLLDAKHHVLAVNTVAIGQVDEVQVHPREVFKPALIMGAAEILLAHNHPSGDCSPSLADEAFTRRLCDAGRLLGVPVLDHVIVADPGRWLSFKEQGRPL